MKKIIILITGIFVTVSCATVKDEENIDYENLKGVAVVNIFGDTIW